MLISSYILTISIIFGNLFGRLMFSVFNRLLYTNFNRLHCALGSMEYNLVSIAICLAFVNFFFVL